MSEQVQQTTSEILSAWNERLLALADKMAEAAREYGPDVADAVLAVARVEAAGGLVRGAIGMLILITAIKLGVRLTRTVWRGMIEDKVIADAEDKVPAALFMGLFWLLGGFTVFAISFGIFDAENVLDLWHWVGLFEPTLWLAHKVLGL